MDPLPHLSRVSGIMEEVLYFKSMSTLMAWFRLALVVPSATMLPELQATFRAFSTARPSFLIQGFVIGHWWCFSSHQHSPCIFLMCADMDSAYSTTCVWWLSMAAALNMSQSVHSNSSCNVSMASAGHLLHCGFFPDQQMFVCRNKHHREMSEARSGVPSLLVAKSTYWWRWENSVWMLAWLKSLATMKTPSQCVDCSSPMEWYRSFRDSLVFALGGIFVQDLFAQVFSVQNIPDTCLVFCLSKCV